MGGGWFQFAPWDLLAMWRSPEHAVLDLIDRPEFTHALMARLTEAHLSMLDQLEEQGLLPSHQQTVHCTGAWTDELPAPGFDPKRPRAKDLWTNGQAQIFSTVSPAMDHEFWLTYAAQWFNRFGLGYYGCCEPQDLKIDLIRQALPNVRKISMSPWANQERGAQKIGRDFVFCRKPSPAFLARDPWDAKEVEADLRATKDICAQHGCPLEYILKDISTVNYQPQRLWEWAEVAKRVVMG